VTVEIASKRTGFSCVGSFELSASEKQSLCNKDHDDLCKPVSIRNADGRTQSKRNLLRCRRKLEWLSFNTHWRSPMLALRLISWDLVHTLQNGSVSSKT